MAQIRIPPTCFFCRVPSKDHQAFKYPHTGQMVLTRVAWQGVNSKGQLVLNWEAQAGKVPSRVRFPTVEEFTPVAVWCPNCLVEYHIGPIHPNDENQPAKNTRPKLVVA